MNNREESSEKLQTLYKKREMDASSERVSQINTRIQEKQPVVKREEIRPKKREDKRQMKRKQDSLCYGIGSNVMIFGEKSLL